MPLYGAESRPAANMAPWFCMSSLTRSIGAATVLLIEAATPIGEIYLDAAKNDLANEPPIIKSTMS